MFGASRASEKFFHELEREDGALHIADWIGGLPVRVGAMVRASIFENDEMVEIVPSGGFCLALDRRSLASVTALVRQQTINPTKPTEYWR